MEGTAKDIADNLFFRMKNLQEFTVFRDIDTIPFNGKPIPFTLSHAVGMPVELTVNAITQEEAEQKVNDWLDSLEDPT